VVAMEGWRKDTRAARAGAGGGTRRGRRETVPRGAIRWLRMDRTRRADGATVRNPSSLRRIESLEKRLLCGIAACTLAAGAAIAGGSPATSGIGWAGGWRATLSGNVAGALQAENLAIVYSEPLRGTFYVEVSLLIDDDDGQPIGSLGIWNVAGTPADPGEWAHIGQLYGSQSCGVVNDGADTLFALTNGGDYQPAASVHVDGWPVVRYGIAGDAATGAVWIRQVWQGAVGDYIGGGDPARGTDPTSRPALSGGAPRIAAGIPVGARATIHPPGEHHGAAPAGFAAR